MKIFLLRKEIRNIHNKWGSFFEHTIYDSNLAMEIKYMILKRIAPCGQMSFNVPVRIIDKGSFLEVSVHYHDIIFHNYDFVSDNLMTSNDQESLCSQLKNQVSTVIHSICTGPSLVCMKKKLNLLQAQFPSSEEYQWAVATIGN